MLKPGKPRALPPERAARPTCSCGECMRCVRAKANCINMYHSCVVLCTRRSGILACCAGWSMGSRSCSTGLEQDSKVKLADSLRLLLFMTRRDTGRPHFHWMHSAPSACGKDSALLQKGRGRADLLRLLKTDPWVIRKRPPVPSTSMLHHIEQ